MSRQQPDYFNIQSEKSESQPLIEKPPPSPKMSRSKVKPANEEERRIMSRRSKIHLYQSFAETVTKTDRMLAIFVVKFDTHGGNMIEWQTPADIDLRGIEFKAMPSGLHRVEKDFVYFKRGSLFGLAAFHRRMLEGENRERGARMKSVGILMQNYTNLYVHQPFLEEQVIKSTEQNQIPSFDPLLAYFEAHKNVVNSSVDLTITHPVGSFFNFTDYFLDNILSLWKASMLGLRILYFREPPIGPSAFTVYDTCLLSRHNSADSLHFNPNPVFYVNVSDIDGLEHESNYIGATTESIFEAKTQLYDIYVKKNEIKYSNLSIENSCKFTDGDRERLRQLNNIMTLIVPPSRASAPPKKADEDRLKQYFMNMNTSLLNILHAFSKTGEVVTPQILRNFNLRQSDIPFFSNLCNVHGFDVTFHPSCFMCGIC